MNTIIRGRGRSGFTVVEIMIVVTIIALIASIAVPNYMRARKRSQALRILDEVKMLEHAIDQYTIENNRNGNTAIGPGDLAFFLPYIKTGSALYTTLPNDLLGNAYTMTTLDSAPKVSPATFDALSDVAPADFWSPYYP
jgi:prepilin-type N-terminal cleavage/methylation domain-containing protein